MSGIYDLTGQNIENTYQRVVQTPNGTTFYDGTGSLLNLGGSTYNTMTGSYGSFYDTGSYLATSIAAIYSMSLSTTDISNGVYVSGSDRTQIYFTNAGIYNVQFSAQFSNSDNTGVDTTIWVRKNDIGSVNDIPDSAGVVTVPPFKAGLNGQTITSWNYYVSVAANDYIQLLWTVDVANKITLETIPAGVSPVHPRVPALIFTAQRIDTFLSNTGSFSGSFTGNLIGTASYSTVASSSVIMNAPNDNFGFLVFTNATSSGVNSLSTQSLRNASRNIRISPTNDALLAQNIGTNQIYPLNTSSFGANLAGTLTAFGNWTFNNTINGTASYANTSSQAISSSYAVSASWAPGSTPPSIYNGNAGTSYPNLATLYVSGSGVTVSSPASGIVSMSISGGGGGGGSTLPGEPNKSIQFNSGSTFSGSAKLAYQYDTSAIDSQQLTFQSSYDFATNKFNKNYPASFFINNNFNTIKQQAGLSHWQYLLAANTGAITIYTFDANGDTPKGNLRMYGFKCDYSLLLRDISPYNAASRVGTLMGAWSYDNTINPIITDTYVDGDQVYNELGTVIFTLIWNGRDIELQMDCTNVSNGDTYFNGLFTNFGTTLI